MNCCDFFLKFVFDIFLENVKIIVKLYFIEVVCFICFVLLNVVYFFFEKNINSKGEFFFIFG